MGVVLGGPREKEETTMPNTPLYPSIRASFSRDVYLPVCGIVGAPVVVWEVRSPADLAPLSSEMPPQDVILPVAPDLTVAGVPLCDVLRLAARSVPILKISDAATVLPLAEFVEYHHVGDALLLASYGDRALLCEAYGRMPLLRGVLDCRGEAPEIGKLPAVAVSHGATSVLLDAAVATAEAVHSLQKRFIHVISTEADGFDAAATRGVDGIVTSDLAGAYAFLRLFPENAFLRRHNLYAHKGFQCDGRYPENSITSVVAAAEHDFDGAEIDVKLTSDNVPVVMHNCDTRGLFDCEIAVTEESTYGFLSSLRRVEFPSETIDRFEDLMHAMKAHPETPVLIEIKPSAKYHKVELLTAMTDAILSDGKSQENCIGIIGGTLDPGLRYVHRHLPYVPFGYCEGGKSVPPAPVTRAEAEERLYRVALLTEGCAASYNPEDVNVNRLFAEYAKFRMLHVFVWSRSWTLSPSKWEQNGPLNDATYLSGYGAWTTDHGEKFLGYPVSLTAIAPAGAESPVTPRGVLTFRDGSTKEVDCGVLPLSGEVTVNEDGTYAGKGARVTYFYENELHFGDRYTVWSEPIVV